MSGTTFERATDTQKRDRRSDIDQRIYDALCRAVVAPTMLQVLGLTGIDNRDVRASLKRLVRSGQARRVFDDVGREGKGKWRCPIVFVVGGAS